MTSPFEKLATALKGMGVGDLLDEIYVEVGFVANDIASAYERDSDHDLLKYALARIEHTFGIVGRDVPDYDEDDAEFEDDDVDDPFEPCPDCDRIDCICGNAWAELAVEPDELPEEYQYEELYKGISCIVMTDDGGDIIEVDFGGTDDHADFPRKYLTFFPVRSTDQNKEEQ